MLHSEDLQEWVETMEEEAVSSCDAFKALQEALDCSEQSDEPRTSLITAATATAKNSAWPPRLLQQTLEALFDAIQGAGVN